MPQMIFTCNRLALKWATVLLYIWCNSNIGFHFPCDPFTPLMTTAPVYVGAIGVDGRSSWTSVTDGWDKLFKDALPQKGHGGLWRGRGVVLRMGIAGLQDVGILARCKGTHRTRRPCQETGFPGKGWLGWTWGYHGPVLLILSTLWMTYI